MSAGTIALTNNSANVTGTGTAFTTELKGNDFIVVIVGGVTYTLGVKATTSATALTLITPYNGPTATGNAWTAVPNATLVGITAQVAADVAKAIRGLNLDKANWQQVFSGTGTITVTLPDGSTYPGPSWSSLSTSLAGKADTTTVNGKAAKGANSDITSLTGLAGNVQNSGNFIAKNNSAQTSGAYYFQNSDGVNVANITADSGGTIKFQTLISGSSLLKRFYMNDMLWQQDANSSASIKLIGAKMGADYGYLSKAGLSGAYKSNAWMFNWDSGNAPNQLDVWVDSTRLGALSVTSTSDALLKKDVVYKDQEDSDFSGNSLDQILKWRVVSFKYKARGIITESEELLGFIANDLILQSPECVKGEGLKEGYDDLDTSAAYTLDEIAMLAKLTGAIQAQQKQIEDLQRAVTALTQPQEQTS